ncbi:MAG: NAD(P)H-dependent oxidoreductase [Bryobacterales bacterium]|nr:NAD(P)H-dependent oxidoreductase [Acidobacteriota bacterium]MCB9384905.1 NAD(P)H-dependent oxidoreductase [Bryobacterales bacterium]
MATVILSAASAERPALQALAERLERALAEAGERDIETFELAATKLAYCQGEFDCWVKTPGLCRAHDAEGRIVQAIHDADRLVMLDQTTFGGHSYTLKRAVDRLICLLSPFFEKRAALTHHKARYERLPSLYKLGWTPRADPELERTWSALADANALNLGAPRVGAALVDDERRWLWDEQVRAMLASELEPGATIAARGPLREAMLAAAAGEPSEGASARSAAIVVGSAKAKGLSASQRMAEAFAGRLEAAGVEVTVHAAIEFLHDGRAEEAARAVAAADLFLLVAPLYVDSLPALATRALELVAAARAGQARDRRFAALLNCGFPEPEHNRTALRIARHFAASAGYGWAGGLALGGGGAIDPAKPLDEQRGPAQHVKAALDLAGPALARGQAIPRQAIDAMAAAPMPDALYRLAGDMGWRYQLYKNGLRQAQLFARPLDPKV